MYIKNLLITTMLSCALSIQASDDQIHLTREEKTQICQNFDKNFTFSSHIIPLAVSLSKGIAYAGLHDLSLQVLAYILTKRSVQYNNIYKSTLALTFVYITKDQYDSCLENEIIKQAHKTSKLHNLSLKECFDILKDSSYFNKIDNFKKLEKTFDN